MVNTSSRNLGYNDSLMPDQKRISPILRNVLGNDS